MEDGNHKALEARLGHEFRDRELLERALTHSSLPHEMGGSVRSNELLEFLGDAVLDLAISHALFQRFPDSDEGTLSKLRASLVNKNSLASIASSLGLAKELRLGKSEESTGGRSKPSILADVYEAVVAAVYLDAGMDKAQAMVLAHFGTILEDVDARAAGSVDYKTRLQEICQARFQTVPDYRLAAVTGPDHARRFEAEVWIDGRAMGRGSGRSKKEAHQQAAKAALESPDIRLESED